MTNKALSIRQPWANLIMNGKKVLEIRSWSIKYRGELIIHAGATIDREAYKRLGVAVSKGELGYLLGTVELVKIERLTKETWEKYRSMYLIAGPLPYGENTFAWVFKNPQRFSRPIRYKGQLRLFTISTLIGQKGDKYKKRKRIGACYGLFSQERR